MTMQLSNDNLIDVKIALISTGQSYFERHPPIGLVYLATYLRDKLGIPKQNLLIIDKNYMTVEQELEAFKPDLIGFTAMTLDYGVVTRLARDLRAKYRVPFILGGVHISTLPESFDPVFDVGVLGEGEATLAEVVGLYSRTGACQPADLAGIQSLVFYQNGRLILTPRREPLRNLDELPLPDFRLARPEYFRKTDIPPLSDVGIKSYLLTSRGCPYRCVFCSTSRFWGKMRFHSPEYTARMVKKYQDELGATHIRVMDDLFTVSVQRLRSLKEAFEKQDVLKKIKGIECQPRANLMSDELCLAMKDLNVRLLNFGFESGSERMLQWLKQESVTVEMNKNAIRLCRKHRFILYGSLMYASPTETLEDMRKTNEFIDFALQNKAKHIWSFVATPFPATPFWEIAMERKKVSNHMDWDLLSHQNIETPLLLDEGIDRHEFQKIFWEGRRKLRKLNYLLVARLLIRRPFSMLLLFLKNPRYYLRRIVPQVIKGYA